MHAGNAAGGEGRAEHIVLALPLRTFHRYARAGQAVDRGEGEVLGLAVVPSQPHEEPGIVRDGLFQVHARSVFQRAPALDRIHIRRRAGLLAQLDGIRITPGMRMVEILQQPDGSVMPA